MTVAITNAFLNFFVIVRTKKTFHITCVCVRVTVCAYAGTFISTFTLCGALQMFPYSVKALMTSLSQPKNLAYITSFFHLYPLCYLTYIDTKIIFEKIKKIFIKRHEKLIYYIFMLSFF